MAQGPNQEKGQEKRPTALNLNRSGSSDSSLSSDASSFSSSVNKVPRTPRFAEATSVHSPIDPRVNPFSDPVERTITVTGGPADVGFGYLGNNNMEPSTSRPPMSPPLKSALKTPGAAGKRFDNPLSPTFREEDILEKREASTTKQQRRDLLIKARVRMAKFALRGVNFSCSLIILSMLSASFAIFNATKSLPSRGGLPSWAPNTNPWPQILVLSMACVSLTACIMVFVSYFRGGHRRAEKVATYYTLFAIGWFVVSMILWAVTAAIFQHSRDSNDNKDFWGWACVQNKRSQIYSDEVAFSLVCRLQNWTLICIIIEIVVEVICITLYSIVFYRYWSKRRLHKSMDMRDKARTDLYLAQLRNQSMPNTPGLGPKTPGPGGLMSPGLVGGGSSSGDGGPMSPGLSQYALSPRFPPMTYRNLGELDDDSPFTPGATVEPPRSQFESQSPISSSSSPTSSSSVGGFKLQAPPSKAPRATPKLTAGAFSPTSTPIAGPSAFAAASTSPSAAPRGNDEPVYGEVAIPGAYADAVVKSPPPPPNQTSLGR